LRSSLIPGDDDDCDALPIDAYTLPYLFRRLISTERENNSAAT